MQKTELSSDDIINSSRNLQSKPMNNLVDLAEQQSVDHGQANTSIQVKAKKSSQNVVDVGQPQKLVSESSMDNQSPVPFMKGNLMQDP